MSLQNKIKQTYQKRYEGEPILISSPGRINLIGEHTDYNDGFVLPAAIDKEIVLAMGPSGSDECKVYSTDYDAELTFAINDFKRVPFGWLNYILGVIDQFQQKGLAVQGFNCVFGGAIPIGAGLSSSAALECGVGLGLATLFGHEVPKLDLIKMAQKAEHTFAGVQCGIMDQFASVMGKADHAIRLDCRSLAFEYFPISLEGYEFLLCDTQVKHALADSAYNTRRQECEEGVDLLQRYDIGISSLRDVTLKMLKSHKGEFKGKVYERCRYVIEENQRVIQACEMLAKNNLVSFGKLMYASHEGLSTDYEVSCRELDTLVDATKDLPYVLGSRMMGGGFGGCTINLVASAHVEEFKEQMQAIYQAKHRKELPIYEVKIQDGTRLVTGI